jgi:predicted kinase
VPGAVVIRSDEIRKRLSGVSRLDRLGPKGYSSEMSERVYVTVAERAKLTIREGHSAIVDAVYASPGDRRVIEHVATDLAVPFVGIWLEAPEATLVARTEQRRNDPSDADAEVIRLQQQQGSGVMTWHRLDASSSPDIVLKYAATYVQNRVQDERIQRGHVDHDGRAAKTNDETE